MWRARYTTYCVLISHIFMLVTQCVNSVRHLPQQPYDLPSLEEASVSWSPRFPRSRDTQDIRKNSTVRRRSRQEYESNKMSQALENLLSAAKSYSLLAEETDVEIPNYADPTEDNQEDDSGPSWFQSKLLGTEFNLYDSRETDDKTRMSSSDEIEPKSKRYMLEISGSGSSRPHSVTETCSMYAQSVLLHIPGCVPKMTVITRCMGTCHSHVHPDYDRESNQIRMVEHCTCCKPLRVRTRTVTFQCQNGPLTRNMSYPFDCTCRPCSTVPSMFL